MAESKNLMGLNLSVDNDLVAEAAREAIVASIAASMSNKEQIVKEFVKSMLSERVLAENGEKPRGYSSERTCSRMEYCVRKALEDAGIPMAEASVTMLPQNYVELTAEEDLTNINRILDLLDADDDVQEVFHNWDE